MGEPLYTYPVVAIAWWLQWYCQAVVLRLGGALLPSQCRAMGLAPSRSSTPTVLRWLNTLPTSGRFLLAMSHAPSGSGIFKCDQPMKLFIFSPKSPDGTKTQPGATIGRRCPEMWPWHKKFKPCITYKKAKRSILLYTSTKAPVKGTLALCPASRFQSSFTWQQS